MSHTDDDKKVLKINDERLAAYEKRTRSGAEQVFYTGDDARDFARYRAERGNESHGVVMHDKPDTIRIQPPEKHFYAQLIDGEWWWLNGCAECNGRPRDWMTYIECDKHNVCRTCKTPRSEIKETPWGGKHGWQCKPCADIDAKNLKQEMLQSVADKEYDEWDYSCCDEVTCPHCSSTYEPDESANDGNEVCDVCGGEYSLEVEHSVSYTTTVVGERLKAKPVNEIKD